MSTLSIGNRSIWSSATQTIIETHAAKVDALIASMPSLDAISQNDAEKQAITHNNKSLKFKKAFERCDDSAKAALLAAMQCDSKKAFVRSFEPTTGRYGGWQQHIAELLPGFACLLSGRQSYQYKEDEKTKVIKPAKCVNAYWSLLVKALDGEEITRESFESLAPEGRMNNIYGIFLAWLHMHDKGLPLLSVTRVEGRKYAAWKLTDQGLAVIGSAILR